MIIMGDELDTEPVDDRLEWAEETEIANNEACDYWKVMIIDDDETVHSVTKLALRHFTFEGKELQFISGYSGCEARKLIMQHPDTALILLDVVMEEDDSGLKVVRYIREELKNLFIRIILRTGQPGQAPEEEVIIHYDINDYKEKTELTARKLFTTVVTALRAYRDIMTINSNREGLEKIIEASASMFKIQSMTKFASGILKQLTAILGFNKNSLYCQASGFAASKTGGKFRVLAATGDFEKYISKKIDDILPPSVLDELKTVLNAKQSMYLANQFIGYRHGIAGSESIIYLEGFRDLNQMQKDLVILFFNNVSAAFDNLYLNEKLADDQMQMLFTLGEMAETRSHEIGSHIKRVALYSRLFALKYGLSEDDADLLKLASSMHDIGKLAIEDNILKKPGKLTGEEFANIQQHSMIGYKILKSSNRPLLKTAAIIALQHHEKFDGSGYPNGLSGDGIHIYGRITAIADVFDALSSSRVYRTAWDINKVLDYISEQRGKHFDPNLVDILLDNLDEFIRIMQSCPEIET